MGPQTLAPLEFGRSICGDLVAGERREWLVTNGLGGFASGTLTGTLTRRYHGLLIAASKPPMGRTLLVTKLDEVAAYAGSSYDLFANRWSEGLVAPRGYRNIERFALEGTMPVWSFALGDGLLEKRLWMEHGVNATYVRYTHIRGGEPIALSFRAFVNYRDFHANTHARDWRMEIAPLERGVRVTAFTGAKPFHLLTDSAAIEPEYEWYRDYVLAAETERGLDDRDDHLAVATFRVQLAPRQSVTFVATDAESPVVDGGVSLQRYVDRERMLEEAWLASLRSRSTTETMTRDETRVQTPRWLRRCVLSADQFVVSRPIDRDPQAQTVIAGYPWFGDWGRDTMIALPGLALVTGRPQIARNILTTFAAFVSGGLLPNYFPDTAESAQYNSVDASLWFIEAAAAYVEATSDTKTLRELFRALDQIVDAYCDGTRYGIALDRTDGLIAAGEPGLQLTWMDAKVDDWVITPRIGKPVEIAALWYNALERLARLAPLVGREAKRYETLAAEARVGFQRFWNADRGYCYDVLDGPHGNDSSLRPNQLFAISLPFSALDRERGRMLVSACAHRLFAGTGVRSLDPHDPRYAGSYGGSPRARDAAYHQGTSWLWLLGAFALAHARAFGDTAGARAYLDAYDDAMRDGGVGTLGEIADGEPPFTPRGAIAQAWSVALALQAWHDAPRFAAMDSLVVCDRCSHGATLHVGGGCQVPPCPCTSTSRRCAGG